MERRETMNLDEVVAASAEGVFVIDPDGNVVMWNLPAEKILGYTAHEVMGRSCCELFGDGGGNGRVCHRECTVARLVGTSDSVHTFDTRTRNKRGCEIWVNISVLTIRNGRAGHDMTVHVFRDVTAARETLARLWDRLARPSRTPDCGPLTPRELEILRIIATGLSSKGAAEKLGVSPATVRNHVQSILTKLGVHNRLEAVACATRHHLL